MILPARGLAINVAVIVITKFDTRPAISNKRVNRLCRSQYISSTYFIESDGLEEVDPRGI